MLDQLSINDTPINRKLLQAIIVLLSAQKIVCIAALLFILDLLFVVFSILLNALHELMCSVAQVWSASGPIERLFILLLAWVFIRSLYPIVKKGLHLL